MATQKYYDKSTETWKKVTIAVDSSSSEDSNISLDSSLTELKFGMDADGNYGYYKAGADTITPFKSGSESGFTVESFMKAYSMSEFTPETCPELANYSGEIAPHLFYYRNDLTTVSLPNVVSIGSYAFYSCQSLSSIYTPNVTAIDKYAFYSTKITLSMINTENLLSIGSPWSMSFYSLQNIGDIFPNCETILSSGFANLISNSSTMSTTVSFSKCKTIGDYAFYSCSSLTSAEFPECKTIGDYAFYSCPSLTSAEFPECETIGNCAFRECSYLTSVLFSNATDVKSYAFGYCSSLPMISLPHVINIDNYTFYYCVNLISLYLMGSSVCNLLGTSAFRSTPITNYTTVAGQTGSIYVPESLYDQYITATNWSLYKSKFVSVVTE